MVHGILNGSLEQVGAHPDPVFGVLVPDDCPGVPGDVLNPRSSWFDGTAYDAQAYKLARMFDANMESFASEVSKAVRAAGPSLGI